jgi:hypothetical protein
MILRQRWWRGLVWAALGCLAGQGWAGSLDIEAMRVEHDAAWRRGPAEQERADEVFILDHVDAANVSQVLLLRRAPVIKGDADAYHDKLARFWRAAYGKAVRIDWLEAGGVKWHYLRRPSSENAMGVFQLSTVFEGRAYSLLVFVPGSQATLPPPVMEMLSVIRFGAPLPETRAAAGPLPAAQPAWRRARTYRFMLSGEALEAVVMADAEHLGRDGMLTGYGLDYGEASVAWFLEGFEWKTQEGRVTRLPWATQGRLVVEAPAELGDASSWTLRLTLPEGEAGVSARLVVWEACGDAASLGAALSGLNRGARAPLERLAATCATPKPAAPVASLRGEAGKTVTATWIFPPGVGSGPAAGNPASRVRLVEAVLEPTPERTAPGSNLLQRARLFFVYEPIQAGQASPAYLPSR